MASISCEHEWRVSHGTQMMQESLETEAAETQTRISDFEGNRFYPETEDVWQKVNQESTFTSPKNRMANRGDGGLLRMSKTTARKKNRNQVLLEGYVEGINSNNEDDLKRTKSLTDDDLDELKGCLDLGFGFSYDEIPELCNTLPALELCYSMSQKFLDEHQKSPERSSATSVAETAACSPIASWKISSPGDHPEDVKARLKFWAQAVACTVRLCS